MQRELFSVLLDELQVEDLINEAIEIRIVEGEAIIDRYALPRF